MNAIYQNMLSAYDLTTEQQQRNAVFEVNQQIILSGLYNGGFFDVAAFYGGTCLRIFHGLQRFSEDMDFSLLTVDENFDFTKYFQPIIDVFTLVGREVEIKKKDKSNFGKVESAFPLDFTHLQERISQFNGEKMNLDEFKSKLKEHLALTDINQVKVDVLPFVRNPKDLDIWSNEYFLQLADRMRVEE